MAAKPIAPLVSDLQKHLHQAQQRQNPQRVKQYQRQDTVGQCMMAPPIVNPKPFVQSAGFYPQQHSYMNSSEKPSAAPTISHSALAFGSQSRRDVPQTYAEPSWIVQGFLDLPDSKRRQPQPEIFGETSLSAQGGDTSVDEWHVSYYMQLVRCSNRTKPFLLFFFFFGPPKPPHQTFPCFLAINNHTSNWPRNPTDYVLNYVRSIYLPLASFPQNQSWDVPQKTWSRTRSSYWAFMAKAPSTQRSYESYLVEICCSTCVEATPHGGKYGYK